MAVAGVAKLYLLSRWLSPLALSLEPLLPSLGERQSQGLQ
jgi:hypothetical protein